MEEVPAEGFAFPKELRLRRRREFDRVFQQGTSVRDGLFLLVCAPNSLPYTRIGLMVSRRIGGAVRRNRVKRLCREAFRLSRRELPAGMDFVVLPKAEFETYSLVKVQNSFQKLLRTAQQRMTS